MRVLVQDEGGFTWFLYEFEADGTVDVAQHRKAKVHPNLKYTWLCHAALMEAAGVLEETLSA
jgi:hypothetical protein